VHNFLRCRIAFRGTAINRRLALYTAHVCDSSRVAIYLADLQMCFTNCRFVLRGRNIYVRIRVYSRKFVHRVVRAKFILREKTIYHLH